MLQQLSALQKSLFLLRCDESPENYYHTSCIIVVGLLNRCHQSHHCPISEKYNNTCFKQFEDRFCYEEG